MDTNKKLLAVCMFTFFFLLVSIPQASAFEWCDWIPFWDCDNPILLEDHSVYNQTSNIVSGERFNFEVSIYPAMVQDPDGKDIVQFVNFSYSGLTTKNGSLVFFYSGELEKGKIEVKKNITEDYVVTNQEESLENLTLYNLISFENLGTPSGLCEYGTTNNAKMWEISDNQGNITVYCFTNFNQIDSTTLEIQGNILIKVQDVEERTVEKWVDVSHKINYLGSNLNNQGYSYYEVSQQKFNPNKSFQTRWTYTPHHTFNTGKWNILAYQSETGLMNAIENDLYLFIDPWWNDSWEFKKEVSNLSGEYPSFNISYDADMNADFSDLRFLNYSESTELNYTLREKVDSSWAYVTVDTNNKSSIYMYFGNSLASTTSSTNNTFLEPLNYYELSDTSDSSSSNDFTNSGASFEPAVIGDGVFFNANDNDYLSAIEIDMGSDWSICNFVEFDNTSINSYYLGNGRKIGGDYESVRLQSFGASNQYRVSSDMSSGTVNGDTASNPITTDNEYYYVCVTREDGSAANVYVNAGTPQSVSGTWTGTTVYDGPNLILGAYDNSGTITAFINGSIDELVFFDKTLTAHQVAELSSMQERNAVFGAKQSSSIINLTLITPDNNYQDSDGSIFFNCSCELSTGCVSLNMTIDNVVVNYTTNNSIQNLSVIYTNNSIPNGDYQWYCSGSTYSESANSSFYNFEVDTTPPVITNATNLSNIVTLSLPINSTWNFNASDPNLDSCYYNTTDHATTVVTCNSSITTTWTTDGDKDITYCANDTLGFETCKIEQIEVVFINVSQSDNPDPVGEGNDVTFTMVINMTNIPSTSAYLVINGTEYPADTVTTSTNGYYFQNVVPMQSGWGNSTGNVLDWYWVYNITGYATNSNTPTENITVYEFDIDDCSVFGEVILNISLKDEATNTLLTNSSANETNIELDLEVSSRSNSSITWEYSNTWVDDPDGIVQVCVINNSLNNSNYRMDFTIGFSAESYAQEFYYLVNGTLDENKQYDDLTTNQITLYDLLLVDSTTFLFKFYDEEGLEVTDGLVHVYRDYIGDGIFREVERGKQDNNGETHLHLVEEDVIYFFKVSLGGSVIYTSATYNAKCLSTPCQIELEAAGEFDPFTTDWDLVNGSFDITSDSSTREVNLIYSLDDPETMNITIVKYTNNPNTAVHVVSDEAFSTGGTLTVSVPQAAGNITFVAYVYKNDELIATKFIDFQPNGFDYFSGTGLFMALLLFIALSLMAASEGIGTVVFGVIAIIVISVLQLMALSYYALVGLICAAAILVWALTKRRRR